MVEDAIGLLIIIIAAVLLITLAGFGLIFSCEVFASALSWFRVSPIIGWIVVGTLAGSASGAVQGMKIRGRADDLRKVYVFVGSSALALLAAGLASPAGRGLVGW